MPSAAFVSFRRFRLRTTPLVSSGDDTDDSSPERDKPRISIHLISPKTHPESLDRRGPPPPKVFDRAQVAFSLDDVPPTLPQRSQTPMSTSDPVSLQPPKSNLIRRVTSKLRISIPSKPSTQPLRSRPSVRTLPAQPFHLEPRAHPSLAVSPSLPNAFVSKEHREAALRERGLRPPRKDLSEQEREADQRLRCIPSPSSPHVDGISEAERFKATWLATNGSSEAHPSDDVLLSSPETTTAPRSVLPFHSLSAPPDARDSDLPVAIRPSILIPPPLSPSSALEVLHEEPYEQAPITPPLISTAVVPIIVSSPVESSPVTVESPVSYTFSSRCPGSTLESQSQSDHSRFPEKGDRRRSRTSDLSDQPRLLAGSSLSRMGTHSLSNLRRSIVGSLRLSSSTLSSADRSPSSMCHAPRTAIRPTIHDLGSIIRETKGIADAESRRLSEIAFLD